ncbi:MAG: hypothetical protein KDB21_14980 [Acidimicrobiales bacterium]|nr:hypothetical protein [Acidimicrobiales bacterium]
MSHDELPNDWGPVLQDLADRRATARSMGGDDKVERHRSKGKLDARQRVERLLDPGTFTEIGTLVGAVPADGLVAGHGLIAGRPVMVGAEDFTTLGGSIGAGSANKRYRISELAYQERVPLIMLLEGAGHRPPLPGEPHGGRSPVDLSMQVRLSGRVPVITGVMGASAGHGALIAPMSDYCVMTEQGAIFTAGPPVVKESLGEDIAKEDLGGPEVAVGSGLVHDVFGDDDAVCDAIRTYLSFFPSNAWQYAPRRENTDMGERHVDELLSIIPKNNRRGYDMHRVIEQVVDEGRYVEVHEGYGRAIVCALAHVGGDAVAIVANNPKVLAGSIDSDAADKASHFIQVADSFHLPIVFLTDNPGVLAGSASERKAILRHGARMFAAQAWCTTVKLQVTLRKAYGFGSMVMSMTSFSNQTLSYAFPAATLGAMGAAGSSRSVKADEDTAAAIRQAELDASYRSASTLGFDELVDPRELRNALLHGLRLSAQRRTVAPEPVSRVGIMP